MFDSLKNMFFNQKKKDTKIPEDLSQFISIVKNSGGSNDLIKFLIENGDNAEATLKQLKKILSIKKKTFENCFINTSNIIDAYQIASSLKIDKINSLIDFEKTQNYSFKSGIKFSKKEQQTGFLFVGKGIGAEIRINHNEGPTFLVFNSQNIGAILTKIHNKEILENNIIGFSSSSSVLDSNLFPKKNLFMNICKIQKPKKNKEFTEMELMSMMQDSSMQIDFHKLLFLFNKFFIPKEMASQYNINTSTMEKQISIFKGIINAMTNKEKSSPEIINPTRLQRISKGSGTSLQQVTQLISLITMIKKEGPAGMQKIMSQMTGSMGK